MDQMFALREQYLVDVARMNGLADMEIPALVRWVTPDEWPQAMSDCLEQEGVEVEVLADGGFSYEGDKAVLAPVVWTCQAQYTIDPRTTQPLDDRQVKLLYDYFVNDLKPCVEGEGYEVADPPSLTTFSESIATGGQEESWSPYAGVVRGTISTESWDELNRACPQEPPFDAMYGAPLIAP
jgi:hypothetical protein